MEFNSLSDWLSWQEKLHIQPIDLGLDRIRPVYESLITTPLATRKILVGGTNGKGSTVAFLESIYVSAGYRVGSYTSPHLFKYNERVRLAGEPVSDLLLCEAFERVNKARGDISLTYFEFGTLAAFDIFQRADLDVVILEIGLGGRLDAVNLVDADVAIVTNIDLDHVSWLGDTREKIAYEKLGIGRANKPLIFADDNPPQNVEKICTENGFQLKRIGRDFGFIQSTETSWQWWGNSKNLFSLPFPMLRGVHQLKNASTALMAVQLLAQELPVSMAHIRLGLNKATNPGRFQVIQNAQNMFIFDVAHNPHGVKAFVAQLEKIPRIGDHYLVLGMLADKNVEEVIQILQPHIDVWYLGGISESRGLTAVELKKRMDAAINSPANVNIFEDVKSAFTAACNALKPNDKVIVLGSFYTVAAALAESELTK